MSERVAVVMAAGQGTRMKSELPKVLVPVSGRPMIDYVLDALIAGGMDRIIVVVGYRSEDVRAALVQRNGIEFAHQAEQLGTGHAVMMCREFLRDHDGPVMVMAGDSPMTQGPTVAKLLDEYDGPRTSCILGTIQSENPTGLGRIVRDEDGEFEAIVEERDATEQQRRIREVNMSYYVFHCPDLLEALGLLRHDNSQGEFYITDVPGLLKAAGKSVQALPVLQECEAMGVNTLEDLAAVQRRMGERASVSEERTR